MGTTWSGDHVVAQLMSEEQLEAEIVRLVTQRGLFLKMHAKDDRRDRYSNRGFPDMLIAGAGGVLFRENKRYDESASPDQLAWGKLLKDTGHDWDVWRPEDLASGRISVELDALTVRGTPRSLAPPG